MTNEKVFLCQDQNNSNQIFFIVPEETSAISQTTASLWVDSLQKKIKNYILNIYTSKASTVSEAENPYLAYKTVGGSVRRCTPIWAFKSVFSSCPFTVRLLKNKTKQKNPQIRETALQH